MDGHNWSEAFDFLYCESTSAPDRSLRVSAVMGRRDTERLGEFLITIKVDVVDAHFAGLDTVHYLLKVRVFDLQSITDQ